MMNLTLIEDCSPFYIRFTHDNIDTLINYANSCIPTIDDNFRSSGKFSHYALGTEHAEKLLSMNPVSKTIPLQKQRVSLFMSAPNLYYRAHKDGLSDRISINYGVRILDDKCITSWYEDNDLSDYEIDTHNGTSRECINFIKDNHNPVKQMIAKSGEGILFNTDLFHDWDNTKSNNERIVLTFRVAHPLCSKMYFSNMRKIMFGY